MDLDGPPTKQEEKKMPIDLPDHSDIVKCFNADGNFMAEHKSLLMKFLTKESIELLDKMLMENPGETEHILTQVALMVLQDKFAVYKGEWELVAKKAKKQNKIQKK